MGGSSPCLKASQHDTMAKTWWKLYRILLTKISFSHVLGECSLMATASRIIIFFHVKMYGVQTKRYLRNYFSRRKRERQIWFELNFFFTCLNLYKQLLGCFTNWQTKWSIRIGGWNLGNSFPELNLAFKWWYFLVYRIITVFSYEFNLDIRFYKIQLYRHSQRELHFECIAGVLSSHSTGRYCFLRLTEETKIYSWRIIETKQSAKPTDILWRRNGTMPIYYGIL